MFFWERYSSQPAPSSLVKLIRKLDPLLDLKWHYTSGKWHVVRYLGDRPGPHVKFIKVLTIEEDAENGKHGFLGSWLYDYLVKCDTRRRDVLKEIEEQDEQKEREWQGKVSDIAYEMAKDLRKPLLADLDGAATTKTVWQGGLS